MRKFLKFVGFAILALCSPALLADEDFQGATHLMPFEDAVLQYNSAPVNNPISQLQKRIDSGRAALHFSRRDGYLDDLLSQLHILKSSQVLVFSKTSFQKELISPSSPRALFFNDDVYIGYIPGAPIMEISAADPNLGGVFYTLNQNKVEKPEFERRDQCLECHATSRTMGVPGFTVRSFVTDKSGEVDSTSGLSVVDHRTPIEDRWGGYYVTGYHGNQAHRGNLIGQAAFDKQATKPNFKGDVTDLSSFFDVDRYPGTNSDIVALMVLEHQTHMHNFITRLRDETALKMAAYGHIHYVTNVAESFLKYMLFSGEAPIKSEIRGNSDFMKEFQALGPFDNKGRSLRQFDLKSRMFKYPCSYLIYSKTFDGLPDPIREYVWNRLREIFTGKNGPADFPEIPMETKRAMFEIIRDTKRKEWGKDG